jgi:UDP-N-acetylmuramyl tripeptide synthase
MTAAVAAAKAAARLSRTLRTGGGTALPGLVAERLDPGIVPELAQKLGRGSVLVTGTNGKTTTSRLLTNIAVAAGLRPVANREGSNMMRGVAAALAEAANWAGELPNWIRRVGVFEVDEATMPIVERAVRPRAIVFTNLFRDQLDRYGEVDTVAALWREAVSGFGGEVTLVLNADDPAVASLQEAARGPVILFGMESVASAGTRPDHAADARWCPRCGEELDYKWLSYAHIGNWSCPGCGNSRTPPDIAGRVVQETPNGSQIEITTRSGVITATLPLSGLYNVYNAMAAAGGGLALGASVAEVEKGLAGFTAAFGRQERFQVAGRNVEIILAKNPAGLNQVLRTITADGGPMDIVFLLNDRIADGQDISWIWDVDLELLSGRLRSLTVSGTRAWDMALRLKYAGLSDAPAVEEDAARALRAAIDKTPGGGTLYVIPTYTAMLDVRNIVGRWAGKGSFWQRDGN